MKKKECRICGKVANYVCQNAYAALELCSIDVNEKPSPDKDEEKEQKNKTEENSKPGNEVINPDDIPF